jgi:hypothetical protein
MNFILETAEESEGNQIAPEEFNAKSLPENNIQGFVELLEAAKRSNG